MGSQKKPQLQKLILPALVFSRLNFAPARNALMLYQIEISQTLELPLGTIGYIRSISSLATVLFSLFLIYVSQKMKSKRVLQIGLIGYSITPILAYFSGSYLLMLVSYLFYGLGLAFVNPIVFSYTGTLYEPERRSKAISWIMAGSSISGLVGTPILGYVADVLGWRVSYLAAVLPISLFSLLLVSFALPPLETSQTKAGLFSGFNNRIILAVIGYMLTTASFQLGQTYGVSYLRQSYGFETGVASLIFALMALNYTLGSLTYGRIGNPEVTKRIVVIGTLLLGVFCFCYTSFDLQYLVIGIGFLIYFTRGISDSACNNYVLTLGEENRSSVMSLNNAAFGIGTFFGSFVGGYILNMSSWGWVGVALGTLGIISSLVFYLI